MRSLFSLVVTVVLGYVLWSYLAPGFHQLMPGLFNNSPVANISGQVQTVGDRVKNVVVGQLSPQLPPNLIATKR